MNISDRLQELAILRQLALERFNAGQYRNLSELFNGIADELEDALRGRPLTEFAGRNLDRQIAELISLVQVPTPELQELPGVEARWAVSSLAVVGVDAVLPPASALASMAETTLIQGAVLSGWMGQLNRQIRFDIERTVRSGVTLGRTNQQIAKDILGIQAQGDKGAEPLKRARRDAMALTRTAVQTFANQAILETYRANEDVLRGVEYVATLDSRTTPQCAALDGAVWDLEGNYLSGPKLPFAVPPIHWQCRSRLSPVTKTFRELGIDVDEIPEGERASAYGPVSGGMKFETFMERQGPEFAEKVLGKGRYELYKTKNLTLAQLIDPRTLTPLTLAELREL